MNVKKFDLLVLGGGVIGLSCVRSILLRHPDLSIGVLDAPTHAMPASLAAAGMLAPFAEFSEETSLSEVCEQGLEMYPEFIESLGKATNQKVTLARKGTLIPDVAHEEERFENRLGNYEKRGIRCRLIEADELRRVEPKLSPQIERAIWLPEALVNNRELHEALKNFALQRGVEWLSCRTIEREDNGDRVIALITSDEMRVEFGRLLAATGAWTGEIARLLDLHFDVRPVKGQMTCLAAPDGFIDHVIHLKELYLAPRPGAGIIVGSTMEEAGFDVLIDEKIIGEFINKANEIVPGVAQFEVKDSWAGLRPKSEDGLPIIGWSPRWQNVLIATGHFRNGILLTPWTGEAVADFFDDPGMERWQEFSPKRFWNS